MPNRPPTPAAKQVRNAASTTSETSDDFGGAGRGAAASSGAAVGSAVSGSFAMSERRDQIDELLSPTGLLDLRDTAAPAVGDARFRDLVVGDGVVGGDIARAQHAGDAQHAHLVVDAHLLRAADDEVAV